MSNFTAYSSTPSNVVVSLSRLGWRPFFSTQLSLDELGAGVPARVIAVHRSGPQALTEHGQVELAASGAAEALLPEGGLTVGDWLLIEPETVRLLRVLERESVFARLAAGKDTASQSIAANVDTLFIVTSCNHDFNPSRLERYLALTAEARVQPVIVLTKRDLAAGSASDYVATAGRLAPYAEVLAMNATRRAEVTRLLGPWLGAGQTVAFVGSSGVGNAAVATATAAIPPSKAAPCRPRSHEASSILAATRATSSSRTKRARPRRRLGSGTNGSGSSGANTKPCRTGGARNAVLEARCVQRAGTGDRAPARSYSFGPGITPATSSRIR
jgi:hypothetical protein